MAGGQIGRALHRLRGLLGARRAEGPTDGDLLRRYVHARDEAAFEALLRRHGPMVLGVCRRLLSGGPDVDDAFQATFLILVRKARSIDDGDRVGNWLYGVAYRVAVRARAQAARQRARERALTDFPGEETGADPIMEELRALVDLEVSRLPARYREAVVCCYLQGRTQEEAARVLGWPKGTVATRLNRARQLLKTRLIRRGLPLSAGTLIGVLRAASADGALPPALVGAALRTAAQGVTRGALPPAVARLADAVLRHFVLTRVKAVTSAALALALVIGGGGLALRSVGPAPAPEAEPAAEDVQPGQYYASRQEPAVPDAVPFAVDDQPCMGPCPGDPAMPVAAIVLTADNKLLVAVSPDGDVCVYNLCTGRACAFLKAPAGQPPAPGERGAMGATGKEGSRAPARKVVITFLDGDRAGSVPGRAGSPFKETSLPLTANARLGTSIIPPGVRRVSVETRVWLPPARAFVPARRVVIDTTPGMPTAPQPPTGKFKSETRRDKPTRQRRSVAIL